MRLTGLKANADILLAGIAALISLLLIAVVPSGVLRTALGLPLVLLYPGYLITLAIFPGRTSLTSIERAGMVPVLSVVATALAGLALNFSPWGLSLLPLATAMALLVTAGAAVAWYRRGRLQETERYCPAFTPHLTFWQRYGLTDRVLTGLLALVLLAAAASLVYYVVTPKTSERFTEFYLLGPGGAMIDYPLALDTGDTADLVLVIINHERRTEQYRVEMKLEGEARWQAGPINLGHGEEWRQEISFTPERSGSQKVEFVLSKQGQTAAYRQLFLQVRVE